MHAEERLSVYCRRVKAEFDRTIDGNFDKVKVTNNGEVLLLSSDEGRVCMYSATGEKSLTVM